MRNSLLVICLTIALLVTVCKAHKMLSKVQKQTYQLASHLLEEVKH
ncbi:MAG: hypothetical protein WBE18_08225 [Gammaproteobacteria bacterium]